MPKVNQDRITGRYSYREIRAEIASIKPGSSKTFKRQEIAKVRRSKSSEVKGHETVEETAQRLLWDIPGSDKEFSFTMDSKNSEISFHRRSEPSPPGTRTYVSSPVERYRYRQDGLYEKIPDDD